MELENYKEFDLIITNGIIDENFIIEIEKTYPIIEKDLFVLLNYLVKKMYPLRVIVNVVVSSDRFAFQIKKTDTRWINVVYWLENNNIANITIEYIKVIMRRNKLDLNVIDRISNKILKE